MGPDEEDWDDEDGDSEDEVTIQIGPDVFDSETDRKAKEEADGIAKEEAEKKAKDSEVQQDLKKFLNEFGLDGVTDHCKARGIKTIEDLIAQSADEDKWDAFCDDAALKASQMRNAEKELRKLKTVVEVQQG